jgi:hypothetical protein
MYATPQPACPSLSFSQQGEINKTLHFAALKTDQWAKKRGCLFDRQALID